MLAWRQLEARHLLCVNKNVCIHKYVCMFSTFLWSGTTNYTYIMYTGLSDVFIGRTFSFFQYKDRKIHLNISHWAFIKLIYLFTFSASDYEKIFHLLKQIQGTLDTRLIFLQNIIKEAARYKLYCPLMSCLSCHSAATRGNQQRLFCSLCFDETLCSSFLRPNPVKLNVEIESALDVSSFPSFCCKGSKSAFS